MGNDRNGDPRRSSSAIVLLLALGLAAACGGNRPAPDAGPSEGRTPPPVGEGSSRPFAVDARAIVGPSGRVPNAVLLLTSRAEGEIGPCGCIERPGGGLARKAAFAGMVREIWPGTRVIWLSAGDVSAAPTPSGRLRTRLLAQGMAALGYRAVNLGPGDLLAGPDGIQVDLAHLPLLSTNLDLLPEPAGAVRPQRSLDTARSRVFEAGGLRVGAVGVLPAAAGTDRFGARDPVTAVAREASRLRGEVDFLVALAILPEAEALRLARSVPELDLVFAGWGAEVTPLPLEAGGVPVVFGGDRGRWLTEVRLHGGPDGLEATETVLHYLGEEVPSDPAFAERVRRSEETLRDFQRRRAVEQAAHRPRAPGDFLGAGACQPCHEQIAERWRGGPHAGAFELLVEVRRDFDPPCQSCHVTGFGRPGGFSNPVRDADLAGVQCEACHGPGREHAEEPEAPYPTPPAPDRCLDCHDQGNDPDFDFEEAWATVAHGPED